MSPPGIVVERGGRDFEFEFAIRQGEATTESPVRPKVNRLTTDGNCGIGMSGAVNDQLRINIEPKRLNLWRRLAHGAGDKVCFLWRLSAELDGGDLPLDFASNGFGDFEGANRRGPKGLHSGQIT